MTPRLDTAQMPHLHLEPEADGLVTDGSDTPDEQAGSCTRTSTNTPNRRQVLMAAGLGIGAVSLAACGGSSTPTAASSASSTPAASSGSGAATASGSGATLVALSAVPVGGAVAASDANGKPIIVAQPTTGKVVAFSAVCTHQGCPVKVDGAQLDCPCHGSKFDALTGAALSGPATTALPKVAVEVKNGNVVPA